MKIKSNFTELLNNEGADSNTMRKKSLNCLNCATFRKLIDYNMRKKSLNFLNVAQLRQFSGFFIIV